MTIIMKKAAVFLIAVIMVFAFMPAFQLQNGVAKAGTSEVTSVDLPYDSAYFVSPAVSGDDFSMAFSESLTPGSDAKATEPYYFSNEVILSIAQHCGLAIKDQGEYVNLFTDCYDTAFTDELDYYLVYNVKAGTNYAWPSDKSKVAFTVNGQECSTLDVKYDEEGDSFNVYYPIRFSAEDPILLKLSLDFKYASVKRGGIVSFYPNTIGNIYDYEFELTGNDSKDTYIDEEHNLMVGWDETPGEAKLQITCTSQTFPDKSATCYVTVTEKDYEVRTKIEKLNVMGQSMLTHSSVSLPCGKVYYEPDTNTLTLDNVRFNAVDSSLSAIEYKGSEPLNIVLNGSNIMRNMKHGILSEEGSGGIVFSGTADSSLSMTTSASCISAVGQDVTASGPITLDLSTANPYGAVVRADMFKVKRFAIVYLDCTVAASGDVLRGELYMEDATYLFAQSRATCGALEGTDYSFDSPATFYYSTAQGRANGQGYTLPDDAIGANYISIVSGNQYIRTNEESYNLVAGARSFYLGIRCGLSIVKASSSDTSVVKVNDNGKVSVKGVGKATITLKAYATNEAGATALAVKKITVVVNPKDTAIKSFKLGKAGRHVLRINLKKLAYSCEADKVQIQIKVKGGNKTITKSTSEKSLVVGKLTAGKKYQVRVRTMAKVGGKYFYGQWTEWKTTGKIK